MSRISSIEPDIGLLLIEFLIAWTGNCRASFFLWPWPWPDDLYIRTWPVSPEDVPADNNTTLLLCVASSESYHITDRQTDTRTNRQTLQKTLPRRFADGNKELVANPDSRNRFKKPRFLRFYKKNLEPSKVHILSF